MFGKRYRGIDMRPRALLDRSQKKVLEGKYLANRYYKYLSAPQKTPCILYGLQRSGTNYVEHLLGSDFPGVRIRNSTKRSHHRHKHWRLYADKSLMPTPEYLSRRSVEDARGLWDLFRDDGVRIEAVVVVVREPLHWYRSYQNWAVRLKWPEVDYHYLQEWNAYYRIWHALAAEDPDRIVLLRYEDLLGSEETALSSLANVLKMPLVDAAQDFKHVPHSQGFDTKKREENLSPLALDKFPPSDRDAILANLDPLLNEALGYPAMSNVDT